MTSGVAASRPRTGRGRHTAACGARYLPPGGLKRSPQAGPASAPDGPEFSERSLQPLGPGPMITLCVVTGPSPCSEPFGLLVKGVRTMRTQSTDHKVRLPTLAAVFLGCVAIACGCAEDRGSGGIAISPLDLSAPPTKIVDVEPEGFPTFQEETPPPPEDPPPPPVEPPPPETSAKGGQGSDGPPPSGPLCSSKAPGSGMPLRSSCQTPLSIRLSIPPPPHTSRAQTATASRS